MHNNESNVMCLWSIMNVSIAVSFSFILSSETSMSFSSGEVVLPLVSRKWITCFWREGHCGWFIIITT